MATESAAPKGADDFKRGTAASAQNVPWWAAFKVGDGIMFRLRGVRQETFRNRPRDILYGETAQGTLFKTFLPFELAHAFTPKVQRTVFYMEAVRTDPNPRGGDDFLRHDAWPQGLVFPKGSPEPDFDAVRVQMDARKQQRGGSKPFGGEGAQDWEDDLPF